MSRVTGMTLVCGVLDARQAEAFRDWLAGLGRLGWNLGSDLSKMSGGGKHPQQYLYQGGLDGFDDYVAQAAEVFLDLPWELPENAVLLMQPEEGPTVIVRAEEGIDTREAYQRGWDDREADLLVGEARVVGWEANPQQLPKRHHTGLISGPPKTEGEG